MSTGNDGLAAKVRGLEQRVGALEEVFGTYPPSVVVGDKKDAASDAKAEAGAEAAKKAKSGRANIGLLCACVVAAGVFVANATDTRQWNIYSGTNDLVVPGSLDVTGTLTPAGAVNAADLTASDDLVVTDDAGISGALTQGAAAVAPTNNQVVTLDQNIVIFRGTGASGSTNTITLTSPWTANRVYWLTVDHRATTDVLVADSAGLLGLGGNIILEPTDSVGLLTTSTTNLVRIGGKSTN